MSTKAITRRPVRVICLGEILFDFLANELDKSVSEVISWTPYPGGAPANVASALVKLGTPAAFIGCVGKDAQGQELVQLLQSIGVNTAGMQHNSQAPTRQVYVTRNADGDRAFAGFGDRQPEQFADAYLQAQYLPTSLFLEAEYLVLGTLELAYPQTRAAVFKALELAEEYHLKIVLDINWRPMFWSDQRKAFALIKQLWKYVDFIKMSKEEALWLFNTEDAKSISAYLDSVEGVIVTDGEEALSYCINDHKRTVKPIQFPVKDTTGAGDAFVAGFIHQLCLQGTQMLEHPEIVKNIVNYASVVGGLTTIKSGAIAAQPTSEEVAVVLRKNQLLK